MRKYLFLIAFIASIAINAQQYFSGDNFTLVGKAMDTPANRYHRVDTLLYNDFEPVALRQFCYPAGLALAFKTNSSTIYAKWNINPRKQALYMPIGAQRGLDLYIKNDRGIWTWAGISRSAEEVNSSKIVEHMDGTMKECLLYLPICSEINNIEIGIDEGATIQSIADPFKKRVLIYGSSIVQGIGASRAGLSYPSILSRRTGINFINLGCSGYAKMQEGMKPMVSSIKADAYILDCIPNPSPNDIKERLVPFVSHLRKEIGDNIPILLFQTIKRDNVNFNNKTRNYELEKMKVAREEISRLLGNDKHLYFFDNENMDWYGNDSESEVDGTHPSDLGYYRFLEIMQPKIEDILRKYINIDDIGLRN